MRTDPPRGQGARRSALDTECNYRHRCPRMGHALALYSSRPGVSERSIHSLRVRHGHKVPSSWPSHHAKKLRATAIYLANEV
jgi:hypothetical protein